jgi:hypothetical protein
MSNEAPYVHCIGCGAVVPKEDGETHPLFPSAAACRRIYGEILAREYADPAYKRVYRLSVDTWPVQHPGEASEKAARSLAGHLVRLCIVLEREWPLERANDIMVKFSDLQKRQFPWLAPPKHRGVITVVDVHSAMDAESHCCRVLDWAQCTWDAWQAHHAQIREWADECLAH